MKKYFITGLIILLPVTLTIIVVSFIFNALTEPFAGAVNALFHHSEIFSSGFLFFDRLQVEHFVSQLMILLMLIALTLILGAITQWLFFEYIIKFVESLLERIPFIRSIYRTSQDVIKTLFTNDNQSFKQVVLVPFPNATTHSIGLLTGEKLIGFKNTPYQDILSVFVPTTPNPTSGFLMHFQEKDLVYLDMTVEHAFKYIISCGVINAPFKVLSKEELQDIIDARNHLTPPSL